jgi:hypothetical protein
VNTIIKVSLIFQNSLMPKRNLMLPMSTISSFSPHKIIWSFPSLPIYS